jgi:hypothetical protein
MSQLDFASEHRRVLDRANQIYIDKSHVRGQMWLEFPPSDKIRELRERVTRIENAYSINEEGRAEDDSVWMMAIVEDALDVINYAAFLIKQIERGQRG